MGEVCKKQVDRS